MSLTQQGVIVGLTPEVKTGGLAGWQVGRVKAHIEKHLHERIRVKDCGDLVCLRVAHFSKMFTRAIGSSPHAYIIRRRLARAEQLMAATDEPLNQIALACGFSDQAHFSNVFRRHVGVTPGQWWRQNRAIPRTAPL